MSDENMQESSAEQTSSAAGESQTATLDDVYKEYNVEQQATDFNPQRSAPSQTPQQPRQEQQPATPAIPDPVLDPNGYKQWHGQQNQSVQQALSALAGEVTSIRNERKQAREEADIKGAVTAFRKIVGDEVDEDMAEVALGAKARKDSRFLAVYNNRQANPRAWDAAVSAYANEFKTKVQFKTDPQLAENVRAAKQSVGGSQSQRPAGATGDDAFFEGKTGRAFDAAWSQYISRNNN